jgi:type I restriction enzyme S subunit
MKQGTFFEKFDVIAAAPDAVVKMRELVLHLAVHGSLVRQSAEDEPAAELLRRSRAAMAKLMAEGKAKNEKPAAPVGEDETTFLVPEGWAWCRLVDAGQFINGLAFKPSDWGQVGRPIIRIQNLSGRNRDYNRTIGTYPPSVLVQDGDILVSWSATLDAFIWRGEEGVLNQHIFRVLPAPMADKGYLFWLLKWVIRQLAEGEHAHGLVMSHINRGPFLAHPIPLPPLGEQQRIAAKVDELMVLCDRLASQQEERETRHAALAHASLARFSDAPTPANLDFLFHKSFSIPPDELRKSILTLAVQGKLVPQGHDDEPAEAILKRVLSSGPTKKPVDDSALNEDFVALPFDLPHGWAVSRLGSLVDPARGISYGIIKLGSEPQQGGVFTLRCSNVRFRRIDLSGIRKVTEQLSAEYGRTILRGGEVLINVRGTLGGCAVVPPELKGYNVAREVAVIPIHQEIIDPSFLLNVIASPYFQDRVDENLRGIAYEGLNLGLLRDFPIPIAPLDEQRRIVAKVDELMALVDALGNQLVAASSIGAGLVDAVLAELTAKA